MKKYAWKEVPSLDIPNQIKYHFDCTTTDNILYVYEKLGYVVKKPNDVVFFPCDKRKLNTLKKTFEKEKSNELRSD